jgi:hypothetical protein
MTDIDIQDETELKKRYLKRYRKNRALINRLNEKVILLDQRITGISSPRFSDMPRGGTPVSKEDLVAEKDEIKDRINRLESKGKIIKAEILDKIDELDDPRYAEILESFCIKCMEFSDIAEDNNYTIRHIIRLYSEGIDKISL